MMDFDLSTFEGRCAQIADNERKNREAIAAYEKMRIEYEFQMLRINMATQQYIAAINAPLAIFALELKHDVRLALWSRKPWWCFWRR